MTTTTTSRTVLDPRTRADGDRWRSWAAVILEPVLLGLLSGWLALRGPVTTGEAFISMGAALAVGMLVGVVTGDRRWALAVPAVFAVGSSWSAWARSVRPSTPRTPHRWWPCSPS